jgi:excisionase family DNA binding protein
MADRKTTATKGLRKATAARLLGVSVNTLDKWIARGRLPLVRDDTSGRDLVDIRGFVPVLVKVRNLRDAGRSDGVVAAAIAELEREDPGYQRAFSELYGPPLEAIAGGRLKAVTVPRTFGPED